MIEVNIFSNNYFEVKSLKSSLLEEHVNRYANDEDRLSSYTAYRFLEDKGIDVFLDEKGCPRTKNSDTFVSISHSNGVVCVAISPKEVGIDIELIKEYSPKLIKKVFTQDEEDRYLINSNREKFFFKIWTRKEAYAKRLGEGLTTFPNKIILGDFFLSKTIVDKNLEYMISLSSKEKDEISIKKNSFKR